MVSITKAVKNQDSLWHGTTSITWKHVKKHEKREKGSEREREKLFKMARLLHLQDFVKNHSENQVGVLFLLRRPTRRNQGKSYAARRNKRLFLVLISTCIRRRLLENTRREPSISANDALSPREFSSGARFCRGARARIKEKLISPSALDEEEGEEGGGSMPT